MIQGARAVLIALMLWAVSLPVQASVDAKIRKIAPNGLVYVVDQTGKVLVSRNAKKPFVPASIAKIATAWLAIEELGADYRFETSFYMDQNRVLYVRGGGDPFLVSEELALIASSLLKKTGKKPFSAITLDTSYFPTQLRIPGVTNNDRSYNALNSALAANFNTIHARRNGKTVRSAEKQTPITPIAISQFRKRGPNGRSRISLAQDKPSLGPLYAGELLAEFIRLAGGKNSGEIAIGPVPANLKPVYTHRQTRTLAEISKQMLLGSNNFIANQVFLEVGAKKSGSPASIEKSLLIFQKLLQTHKLGKEIRLVEGSGISRENRVTARGFARLLDQFAPYANLLKRSKKGSFYKTGTLSTVSTLAGFARTQRHGMVRFVIALPGRAGNLRFRILSTLEKEL